MTFILHLEYCFLHRTPQKWCITSVMLLKLTVWCVGSFNVVVVCCRTPFSFSSWKLGQFNKRNIPLLAILLKPWPRPLSKKHVSCPYRSFITSILGEGIEGDVVGEILQTRWRENYRNLKSYWNPLALRFSYPSNANTPNIFVSGFCTPINVFLLFFLIVDFALVLHT